MEYFLLFINSVIYFHVVHFREVKAISCKLKMTDVVFLLDSSSSIHEHQFQQQLTFVKNVVNQFEISENNIQVGIVTFSHTESIKINFFLNSYLDKDSLLHAILNITYLGGGTDTGEAIRYGRTKMFSKENGGRTKSNKVMIVVTDGISSNQTKTDSEARLAKLRGIHMIAVGVGNAPEEHELKLIASNNSVYRVDNFGSLTTIVDTISEKTCNEENGFKIDIGLLSGCIKRPMDVFFVLDNSNSIYPENFKKVLKFITDVILKFDLNTTRVGIISYSDDVRLVLSLENEMNRKEITEHILNLKQLTGGTETGKAIRYLNTYGFSQSQDRPEAARVALLFSDGKSSRPDETRNAATEAKKNGIYLIAVGIENESDFSELKEIASHPKDKFLFNVQNFDTFSTIGDGLVQEACQVPADTKRNNKKEMCMFPNSTDVTFVYDSSTIGLYNSKIIRKSIGGVVKLIDFTNKNVRVGVLSKTCSKQKNVFLKDYKGKAEFIRSMSEDEADGLSNLLRKYRIKFQKKFLKRSKQHRHRSIVIVFIDDDLAFEDRAGKESKRVAFNNELYVMSIGNKIRKSQTEKLCSNKINCLYHSSNYNELPYNVQQMFRTICK